MLYGDIMPTHQIGVNIPNEYPIDNPTACYIKLEFTIEKLKSFSIFG